MLFINNLMSTVLIIPSLIATAIGVGLIITVHEFGHFIFARLFNIPVPTFSIGFGPIVYTKRIGSTNFSLSAIPFGGYVDLTPANQHESDRWTATPWYKKMLIMIGGIFFNVLFSFFIFYLVCITGAPKTGILFPLNATMTIGAVQAESSAERAGLHVNDTIVGIDQVQVSDMSTLIELFNQAENSDLPVTVQRIVPDTHEPILYTTTLKIGQKHTSGRTIDTLGMSFALNELTSQSPIRALYSSLYMCWFHIKSVFHAYLNLFKKPDFSQLGGPIMIMRETLHASYKGVTVFLLVLALISINLAILNLIPLPILDGGQMLLYTIEAIARRPLSEKVLDIIRIASWLMAIVLFVFLSIHDIMRIASPYIEKISLFFGIK